MLFILVIVIGLVAWALHLMQEAIQSREFSLMLAGFLVSSAAAALMSVYFLMGHFIGYMSHIEYSVISDGSSKVTEWVVPQQFVLDESSIVTIVSESR